MTADGLVTESASTGVRLLKGLIAAAVGATAGDKVAIREVNATGRVVALLSLPANGTESFIFEQGIVCDGPLYYTEQKTGGAISTTVIFE